MKGPDASRPMIPLVVGFADGPLGPNPLTLLAPDDFGSSAASGEGGVVRHEAMGGKSTSAQQIDDHPLECGAGQILHEQVRWMHVVMLGSR